MISNERVKFDPSKESLKKIIDKRIMAFGKEKVMRGETLIIGSTQDRNSLLKDVKHSQVTYEDLRYKDSPILISCEFYEVEYEDITFQLALGMSCRSGILKFIQTEIDLTSFGESESTQNHEESFRPLTPYDRYLFNVSFPEGRIKL